MPKLVGFIFGAIAGLVAAAWLYGGSTWGPGFSTKEAGTQSAPQFKLSSVPPADKPVGDAPPTAGGNPPQPTSNAGSQQDADGANGASSSTKEPTTGAAPPTFNTGGNPNVEVGAGPNWGYGFRLGKSTNDSSGNRRSDLTR